MSENEIIKGPKLITGDEELALDGQARKVLSRLSEEYPHARLIDLLNAFLRVFTELTQAEKE